MHVCFTLGQGKSLHCVICQKGVRMCPSTTKHARTRNEGCSSKSFNSQIHAGSVVTWTGVFFLKSSDVMPRNLCQRNLKTSRRFRLLWTLFGQRSDNNFGHNPCDVDFGQIPGDDNFGCIPAAGNFWSLSRSQRERGTVTVPQSIHSHNLNSNPGRFTVNFTLSSLNRY